MRRKIRSPSPWRQEDVRSCEMVVVREIEKYGPAETV